MAIGRCTYVQSIPSASVKDARVTEADGGGGVCTRVTGVPLLYRNRSSRSVGTLSLSLPRFSRNGRFTQGVPKRIRIYRKIRSGFTSHVRSRRQCLRGRTSKSDNRTSRKPADRNQIDGVRNATFQFVRHYRKVVFVLFFSYLTTAKKNLGS